MPDWTLLIPLLEQPQRIAICSHVRPDADAIGSEIALADFLRQRGKTVTIVNPSAAPGGLDFLTEGQSILTHGDPAAEEALRAAQLHMIVDTSAWGQLQDLGRLLKETGVPRIVIDHHVSSDDMGATEFKDSAAPANGLLIFELGKALGATISPTVANALYCAIATDTGWFRFPSTNSQTMRVIAELIDFGASPHAIYERLYERQSIERLRLSGRAMERIAVVCGGKLAYTWVEAGDFAATGARPPDTEELVNRCLMVADTVCAFIAIEQYNRQVKVSFRSRLEFDVSAVAEQFGGGGHRQAAGATLPGPLAEAREKVLTAMRQALNCGDASGEPS